VKLLLAPLALARDVAYFVSGMMGVAGVVLCTLLVVSDRTGGQIGLGNTVFDVVSIVAFVALGAMVADAYCSNDDGALFRLAVAVFAVWFTVRGLFSNSQQTAMEASWIVAGACCVKVVMLGRVRIPVVDQLVDTLVRPQH
jgi:hypothetical protein